jgi:hypothetical protein
MVEAAKSYVRTVLRNLPDEQIEVPGTEELSQLANPYDPSLGYTDDEEDKPYDPWEDDALDPDAADEPVSEFLDMDALRRRQAEKTGRA